MKNFLQNILSIKNENYHKIITLFGIKFKFFDKLDFFKNNRETYEIFIKRNISRNVYKQINGILDVFKDKIPFYLYYEARGLYSLKEKINLFLLNRINLPQIEYTITTNCTLKCEYCANYIPRLKKDEHYTTDFKQFKTHVDNLLSAVHNIYNFILIGGETLLVKDLDKYLQYVASKRRIKTIWIITNGTLLFSEKLLKALKKYKNKVYIHISNYSENQELKGVLKYDIIKKQLEEIGVKYIFNENSKWQYVNNDLSCKNRTKEENIKYYLSCLMPCSAIYKDKIYPCPKAAIYDLKKLCNLEEGEAISLNDRKNLKKKLFKFFCRNYYSACGFCTRVEDKEDNNYTPAIQMK